MAAVSLLVSLGGCDRADRGGGTSTPQSAPTPQAPQRQASHREMSAELRRAAFAFRMPAGTTPLHDADIDGLVVDWGLGQGDGFVTIVCMNEGSVSLYFGNGGGIIGGGEHDSVRVVARDALAAAVAVSDTFREVDVVPDPTDGVMRFTILRGGKLLLAEETVERLSEGQGRLAQLSDKVQELIMAIRMLEDRK